MTTEPEYDYNDKYIINKNHADKIKITLCKAMKAYPRLMVILAVARLPDNYEDINENPKLTCDFIASLQSQINADLKCKSNNGTRVYPCSLRYAWVREFDKEPGLEDKKHYHFMLCFNKDTYAFLGDYKALDGNLASMIQKAWCRALGVSFPEQRSLFSFYDENPKYYFLSKEGRETEKYRKFIYRVSYMAKEETKKKGDGRRNFGCSQH